MEIDDIVRFEYGETILTGTISQKLPLSGWYLIEVERPRGFTWRNDEPFCVMMHEDYLEHV